MQILVVAATTFEIAPFLEKFPGADHIITGVGAASTVYHLTKCLHQMDYDLVIQAGIAGSFNTRLALGEVVLVEKDAFGDLGLYEKNLFTPVHAMGFDLPVEGVLEKGWLVGLRHTKYISDIKVASGITVNMVSADKLLSGTINRYWKADIETMEGAALHYVCLMEGIPFLQIRGISNFVGERDKSKWAIPQAIKNVNEKLIRLVTDLQTPSK